MIRSKAKEIITRLRIHESFYLVDMTQLEHNINTWMTKLPHIKPYYAVKCNPDSTIIRTMINKGMGFDCASKNELQSVLELSDKKPDIIFAHPCKHPRDIDYAFSNGVHFTSFDSHSELEKLRFYASKARLVLRIKVSNPYARIQLGDKYGAEPQQALPLLQYAKKLGLVVDGVSFHVGSANNSGVAFQEAIKDSKMILEYARKLGYSPTTLDIGGGFTCNNFDQVSDTVNQALNDVFSKKELKNMNVIAEPGRYMVENVFSLFTPIIGKKKTQVNEYWITDSLYGSFNCILYDKQLPIIEPLFPENKEIFPSKIWGATCDSADCVVSATELPEMNVGDWLMFPSFGAYTLAGACQFNGIDFTRPKMFYTY